MFKKMVAKELSTEAILASIFYKKDGTSSLRGVQLYGLSYLGEYLERYERANISPLEIIRAIASEPMSLPEYQIYDGQLEGFISEVEPFLENDIFFINKLCYGIFLYKLGKLEESSIYIKNLIIDIDLDENFNLLTLSLASGNIPCNDDIRNIVIEKLNTKSINIDFERLIDLSIDEGLNYPTGVSALKFITKAYNLKEKDFEDKGKFNFYKELKNTGTKNANYENIINYMDISKQDYYFLCLKIAKESYSNGSTLNNALTIFTEAIRENINVNSKHYIKFFKFERELIKIDGRSGGWHYSDYGKDFSNLITLSKASFENVQKEYFKEALIAYCEAKNKISYDQVAMLFYRNDFIEFLESIDDEQWNDTINNLALDVLAMCSDKNINLRYFKILKNIELIPSYGQIIMLNRGFIDIVDFMEKFFVKQKKDADVIYFNLLENPTNTDFIRTQLTNNLNKFELKYAAFKMAEYMIDNDVLISRKVYNSHNLLTVICKNACDYALSIKGDSDAKKEAIKIIDDFCYMYVSTLYADFIFKVYEDVDAREVLSLTAENIKEIATYALNCEYLVDNSLLEKIKELAFDETDYYLNECISKIDSFINNYNYFTMENKLDDYNEFYKKGSDNLKARVRSILKEKLMTTNISVFKYQGFEFFKMLIDKELIRKNDLLSVISYYFDSNN